MTLVLLKRSDAALVLVACHEGNCDELAAELSHMQAFKVEVVACLPALGGMATELRATLAEKHVMNGWFAICVGEALRIVSYAFDEALGKDLEQECSQDATPAFDEECNEEPSCAVAVAVPRANEGWEQDCTEEHPNKMKDEAPDNEECNEGARNAVADDVPPTNEGLEVADHPQPTNEKCSLEPPNAAANNAPQVCCQKPPNVVADNEPQNEECCLEPPSVATNHAPQECHQEPPNVVADNAPPIEECCLKPPNVVADNAAQECCQEPPSTVENSAQPNEECSQTPPNDATKHNAPHGTEDEGKPPSVAETAWEQSDSQAQTGDDDGEEMSELSSVCSCDSLPQRRRKEQHLAIAAAGTAADTCAAQCLEACPREQADTATTIKTWLNEHFDKEIALAVLLNYQERVLRKGRGAANQRMLLDGQGCTVRLRAPALPDFA